MITKTCRARREKNRFAAPRTYAANYSPKENNPAGGVEMKIPECGEMESEFQVCSRNITGFLLKCWTRSRAKEPYFKKDEACLLYSLIGVSLKEMYGKRKEEIPELIEIGRMEMNAIANRILKRNPNIVYL